MQAAIRVLHKTVSRKLSGQLACAQQPLRALSISRPQPQIHASSSSFSSPQLNSIARPVLPIRCTTQRSRNIGLPSTLSARKSFTFPKDSFCLRQTKVTTTRNGVTPITKYSTYNGPIDNTSKSNPLTPKRRTIAGMGVKELFLLGAGAASVGLAGFAMIFIIDAFKNTLKWVLPLYIISECERTVRFYHSAMAVCLISMDYKWTFWKYKDDTKNWKKHLSEVHQRSAERLLKLCKRNGGVFVKAGQYIASLNHILPSEYTDTLSVLQDKASFMPYKEVKRVIEEDLKRPLGDIFREIDEVPIAAASLAQVHHAYLKDNTEVAVKVQYLGLPRRAMGDLLTLKILTGFVGWLFPQYEYSWTVPEFDIKLKEELDFLHEGRNAERIATYHQNEDVKIPNIYWRYSAPTVLVMEWCPGVKITDSIGLDEIGVNKSKLAELLLRVYSEQIFLHGFLHADPHPGNLCVRIKKGTKHDPELIILDHGLCEELPTDLRLNYCNFWKYVILKDWKKIEHYARALGAGDLHNLFLALMTFRSESDTPARLPKSEREKLKHQVHNDPGIVSELLQNLPRPLLLVFKTASMIRSIHKDLGNQVDRYTIMARACIRGIHAGTQPEKKTLLYRITEWKELFMFNLNLTLLWLWVKLSSFFSSSTPMLPHP